MLCRGQILPSYSLKNIADVQLIYEGIKYILQVIASCQQASEPSVLAHMYLCACAHLCVCVCVCAGRDEKDIE